jgi:two-component system response regulator MprA
VRILVVDDDQAVLRSIDRALRLEGYDVETVGSGGEALESLAQSPPDALVLDLGLPDFDGLQVCRRMRSAGDDTPVLMLTARDAVDDRVQGLDAGADDYLVKPFALAELLARL